MTDIARRPAEATQYHDALHQVRILQQKLSEIAETLVTDTGSAITSGVELAQEIRKIRKMRASRRAFFDESLFGEPAWDMLLELYVAELIGRPESVSSLCLGSDVPATTALRWVHTLEHSGWAVRTPDPKDKRRYFVSLSDKGRDALNRLFRVHEPSELQGA